MQQTGVRGACAEMWRVRDCKRWNVRLDHRETHHHADAVALSGHVLQRLVKHQVHELVEATEDSGDQTVAIQLDCSRGEGKRDGGVQSYRV